MRDRAEPVDERPPDDEPRPLKDHIVELSIRLRRIFIAIGVSAAILSLIPIDYKYYIPLISYFPNMVIRHVLPSEVTWRGKTIVVHIAQYNPFAGFNILIKTALLLGLLGASPVIAKEIYEYVAPALYPHERRKLKWLSIVAIGLFMLGILTAFFVVLPFAFRIMIITSASVAGQNTLIAFSDVEQLFSTIILISVATGIAFEAPLIVYLLVSFGVIEKSWFEGENRKWILLGSMILGAIISPDPSGIGMLVIGTAMFLAIMFAAKLASRGREEFEEEGNQQAPEQREVAEPARAPPL